MAGASALCAVLNPKEQSMKKLIAALILATSFAALADDAAKKEPAKTEKKAEPAKKDAAAKDAKPAAEKAPEKK
jgi:Ni/Co efflux regulator RcnB